MTRGSLRLLVRLVPLVAGFVGLTAASVARADVGDSDADYDPGPAVRRSAFAGGVTMGALFGGVSGYPNDAKKINAPQYEASTGPAGGTVGGFWIGAAPRDWIVFGLGTTFGSVAGSSSLSNGAAFVLHLEGFPLFYQGGAWRDVAVIGEFGAGGRNVFKGSVLSADGGVTSYGAVGLLYESIRIGRHVSAGPVLTVGYTFSQTLTATLATAGVQISYYGGPG